MEYPVSSYPVNSPFQFLYGAIKGMVPYFEHSFELHFNSYMVRLKINLLVYSSWERPISIPIWCD